MDREEQIIMALAEQLLSEFSRTELRTFLASSPMGVEMRDCSLGVHRLEGEEHLLAEVPDMACWHASGECGDVPKAPGRDQDLADEK